MSFRLVDTAWERELAAAAVADRDDVRIVCPFIKRGALERLLKVGRPRELRVVTRFNLADFADGVSDLSALRVLLDHGAKVRGVRNLHAKLYLFGSGCAIATSANLTDAALLRNHEFGFIADDPPIIERCAGYFDELWARAVSNLTLARLEGWEGRVARHLAAGARPDRPGGLGDEGADAGAAADPPNLGPWVAEAPQSFVKFLGEGHNRVALDFSTLEEIQRAGCHWAVAYPASKRPTGVQDGAVILIGRLTKEPNDIRIFGRAIAMRYVPGRDDATPADIVMREWKKTWPRYVRVHHAEFVRGSMNNGVSLNTLMDRLKARSFAATMRNMQKGTGNTDPRRAYRQQAAVELSPEGAAWLVEKLEAIFIQHGRVAPAELASLDWPDVPKTRSDGKS
jgi:hypothetical protein